MSWSKRFPEVRPGDRIRLAVSKSDRIAAGSRAVVERVVKDVDRHRGPFTCIHVRSGSGEVAGLASTVGHEFEVVERGPGWDGEEEVS